MSNHQCDLFGKGWSKHARSEWPMPISGVLSGERQSSRACVIAGELSIGMRLLSEYAASWRGRARWYARSRGPERMQQRTARARREGTREAGLLYGKSAGEGRREEER